MDRDTFIKKILSELFEASQTLPKSKEHYLCKFGDYVKIVIKANNYLEAVFKFLDYYYNKYTFPSTSKNLREIYEYFIQAEYDLNTVSVNDVITKMSCFEMNIEKILFLI